MRNILINIALLLLSGCASTRVIKHDFATISSQLQDSYKIDFQKSKEWEGTELFIFDYRIELKEYKENEFLKLKTYSDILGTMTTTLTLTPESESETKVKVSIWHNWFIIWNEREKQREHLDWLEDELNKSTTSQSRLS